MPLYLTTWDRLHYFPSEGNCAIFIAVKNQSSAAGFEPANLEYDIHANH
jgi:hypothetical protein